MMLLTLFCLLCAAGELPASVHWVPVGPRGVTVVAVAIDPDDPSRWAVLSADDEVLVTEDSGARWAPAPGFVPGRRGSSWRIQDRLDEIVADVSADAFGQDVDTEVVQAEALERLRSEIEARPRPPSLRFGNDGLEIGEPGAGPVSPPRELLPPSATAGAIEGDVVLAITPSGLRRRMPGPPPVVPRDARLDCVLRRARPPSSARVRRFLPTLTLALGGDDGARPPTRDLTPPRRTSAISVGLGVTWDVGRVQPATSALLLAPSDLTAADAPTAGRASERRASRYRESVADRARQLLAERTAIVAESPAPTEPGPIADRALRIAELDAQLDALTGPRCPEAKR